MLKFDGCNSRVADMKTAYPQMSRYLNQTGRRIVFSCSWPDYERATGINVQLHNYCVTHASDYFYSPTTRWLLNIATYGGTMMTYLYVQE